MCCVEANSFPLLLLPEACTVLWARPPAHLHACWCCHPAPLPPPLPHCDVVCPPLLLPPALVAPCPVVSVALGATLHIRQLAGKNSHHIVEATFKAFARALRKATEYDERRAGQIASSKGVLTQQ